MNFFKERQREIGQQRAKLKVDEAIRKIRANAERLPAEERALVLRVLERKIATGVSLRELQKIAIASRAMRYSIWMFRTNKAAIKILMPAIGLAYLFLFMSVLHGFGVPVPDPLGYLPSPANALEWLARLSPYLITPVGVLLSFVLFACRGYLPSVYGTAEIFVGIWTIDNTATAISLSNIPSLIPFLAGIYVVIRGLDNFAKALDPSSRVGRIFSLVFNNPSIKHVN